MAETTTIETEKKAETPKRSKGFIIILGLLVIGGLWFGLTKYFHGLKHEETDDAQVAANISPVISKIPGYVREVFVTDNDIVTKGDTLITLDDKDQLVALHQAEAALETAISNRNAASAISRAAGQNINTSRAAVAIVDAQIETAKVSVTRATQDFNRYDILVKDHSVTLQQYEQALAAKQLAERQLQVLREQRQQAAAQTGVVSSQSTATASQISIAESTINQRKVDVENAKLNLSYTIITAKEGGRVSKVTLQPGQFLQAGQSLFSVVHNEDKWVIANFKETQFNKMTEGQKVTIHADAFPGHDFDAELNSFAPATGSEFALLPPDNASGNFVKVVQRLPVKITFSNHSDSLLARLRPGMNVTVDVHVGS